jgi:hypothetical protein
VKASLPLKVSDLEYQDKGPYLFERWAWKHRVQSPLGDFEVTFTRADGDLREPDHEMLRRGDELIRFVQTHGEYLLDIVYGYYLLAQETEGWLEMADVPRGLTRGQILPYIRDDRTLQVSHSSTTEPGYSSALNVVPLWDEEHALPMTFENGRITAVSDSPFKLEAGVLRFLD